MQFPLDRIGLEKLLGQAKQLIIVDVCANQRRDPDCQIDDFFAGEHSRRQIVFRQPLDRYRLLRCDSES